MVYVRLLMDHVCEEQLLCDHDTRYSGWDDDSPRFVMVSTCKLRVKPRGVAVCDRRAINFRSKAARAARRGRQVKRAAVK